MPIPLATRRLLSLPLCAWLAQAAALVAADGDLDTDFWGDGKMNYSSVYDGTFRVGSVLAAPDDRLVVVAARLRSPDPDALFWQRVGSTTLSTICNFEPPGGATAVFDVWGAIGTFDVLGRLLVAGTVEYGAGNRVAVVARFLYPDCTLDTSFDGDGFATFNLTPDDEIATAIDTDIAARVYVAGAKGLSDANQEILVMRLESDGDLDPTFSGNGWLTLDSLGLARQDLAMAVTVQADHKPVVAGYADVATGNFDAVAVRFTLTGALDPTFSDDGVASVDFDLGGLYDTVTEVAFDFGSGRLALAGAADAPGTRRASVAMLTSSGALDIGFSGDGKTTFLVEGSDQSALSGVVFDGLGRLVATGIAYDGVSGPADFAIVRLAPNGALDSDFGPNGSVTVPFDLPGSTFADHATAIALLSGRPVVGGQVRHSDDRFRPALVRLETALVFADGFDTGSTLAWRSWY